MKKVELSISDTVTGLKLLQDKVTALEAKHDITTNLLESTQQQLDGPKNEFKDNVKLLEKT